nr:hypothetical protein [Tanacetum cinerariifolium]
MMRLTFRLGHPPSSLFVASSKPLQIGSSIYASTSRHDFARKILEDDFATTYRDDEIGLTLFPLALGPYVILYPFDGLGVCSVLNQENKELHSQNNALSEEVKRLQSQLANAKDFTVGLSDELLSGDEFNPALAHVASLGIAFGAKNGLRIWRTEVEFEAAAWNVSKFSIRAEAEFNKALDAFPS